MKIVTFGKILIITWLFISTGFSTEGTSDSEEESSKKRKFSCCCCFATDVEVGTPDLRAVSVEAWELPKIIHFPEQMDQLTTEINQSASSLRILIRHKNPYDFKKNPVRFPQLNSLRTLSIYHSLHTFGVCQNEKVHALLPLLQAPNLQKIVFTAFLAEEILPHISPNVELIADFGMYDMRDSVILPDQLKSIRNQTEKFCQEKGYKVKFPE